MRFSSCYFCGTAVDADVRPYSLRPAPERPTVTLCPSCRAKLDAIGESLPLDGELLVASNETDETDADTSSDRDKSGPETAAERSESSDDERADASPATETPAPDGWPAEDGSITFESGPDESEDDAGIEIDPERSTESTAPTTGSSDGPDPATDREPESESESEPASKPSPAAAAAPEPDAAAEGDAADAADGADGAAGAAGSSSVEQPPSELYNQIARLLQNREFPIDRREFTDLAVSAYDLAPDDVEWVLDYAVETGRLAEEGGTLRKPS